MKISINQPAYLPWLGYFDRIENSDLHVVLDHVQFEKNSMVNRNKILTKNGELLLTVPVSTKKKFGNLELNKISISNQNNWQKKHWESIKFSYAKSPFFKCYSSDLEALYTTNYCSLLDLLKSQLSFFLKSLKIETPIVFSSDMLLTKSKSELVHEICKSLNASTYISGCHGKDYLDIAHFSSDNIDVVFQNYEHPNYEQFNSQEFVPYLSTLDLLMNYGPKALSTLKTSQD